MTAIMPDVVFKSHDFWFQKPHTMEIEETKLGIYVCCSCGGYVMEYKK